MDTALKVLTGSHKQRFEAIQSCLVPRYNTFSEEQKFISAQNVDVVLRGQDKQVQFLFFTFLFFIDFLSILYGFKIFKNLCIRKKNRLMQLLFDSPIGLLRKGFWGLNTLAKMGVYTQASIYKEIGYHLREVPVD